MDKEPGRVGAQKQLPGLGGWSGPALPAPPPPGWTTGSTPPHLLVTKVGLCSAWAEGCLEAEISPCRWQVVGTGQDGLSC